MQKPINTSERNSAFLKFLLFFLLSVAMVTAAIYFDFRMPFVENKILKEKSEYIKQQNLQQENITNTFIEAKLLIDSIDKAGVNVKYIADEVTRRLGDLNKLNLGDSSIQKRMNIIVTDVFLDLNELKSKTTNMSESQSQIAELISQNDRLKKDLSELQLQYSILKSTSR